jgi:hypothetical protein
MSRISHQQKKDPQKNKKREQGREEEKRGARIEKQKR